MPSNDIQKFLEEEKERSERKQELIKQLLTERDAKIAEYDEQLALLGYREEPGGSLSGSPAPARTRRQRHVDPSERFCQVCGAKGHDTRSHRRQGDRNNWKPFTAEELELYGLQRAS